MQNKSPARRFALTALASLSLCAAAQAQSSAGNWYLSPSINRLSPDSDWNPDKDGTGFGLKLGRALTDHWDLQLGLNSASSKEGAAKYRQTLLGADALYLFGSPDNKFRPFVSAGLGAARDAVSGTRNASETSPFVSGGLGARYQFTEKLALQADWKRVHSILKSGSRTAFGFGSGNNTNNNYLGLALNYTFGTSGSAPMKTAMTPPPAPMETAMVPPPAPAPMVAAAEPAPAPAAAPAPATPAAAKAAPRMEKITMQGTELFALNKAELRSPQPKLDELADLMVKNPSISNVVVTGHTDRLGTDKTNKALSQRRADAVKAYLVGKGVGADRIKAVGKGSSQPVKTCTVKDRAKLIECLEPNRRVEVEPVTFERQVN